MKVARSEAFSFLQFSDGLEALSDLIAVNDEKT
jgi:hypothetical protein